MDHEEQIAGFLTRGELHAAASAVIEHYGPEVLGFLVTQLRNHDDASEVFSQACEDLWQSLPRFAQRCSSRTWFYTLARHAAARARRSRMRDPQRRVPLSAISELAASVRSRTLPHLHAEVQDRLAMIRGELSDDDRALLVLRVDRELDWLDVARVFATEDADEDELKRISARLRKRFQHVKDNIRRRAGELGLLHEHEP
ncbi:MAG: hypothetical protein RLZZ450_6900 [Pseudomonadota bacterium]|jgi:RNA polymerase sigma-70 factor (ECF subfamily)